MIENLLKTSNQVFPEFFDSSLIDRLNFFHNLRLTPPYRNQQLSKSLSTFYELI